MMPKHILLASDFSKAAARARGPVGQLALQTGARISLVHVVYAPLLPQHGIGMGAPIIPQDYEHDRQKAEQTLEEEAKDFPADVQVTTAVVVGSKVAGSLIKYAEDEQADLIALSTHGRTGFRRLVLGSIAEEVLRRSPLPILCFPKAEAERDISPENIQHVLVPTDLSSDAMRPLEPVIEFAQADGCKITVLHVVSELYAIPQGAPLVPPMPVSDAEELTARAQASVDAQCAGLRERVSLKTEVISNVSPAKGILEYADQNQVDLIALSTHGHTGFRRWALGSVAEQVLRRSSLPVLSFPRSET